MANIKVGQKEQSLELLKSTATAVKIKFLLC